MAMKTVRKAYFFRTEQDKQMRKAFILYWMEDKETNAAGFTIEPPGVDDDAVNVLLKFNVGIDKDFREMVQIMRLMIQPVEVVIK